jgi:hypothetical protein
MEKSVRSITHKAPEQEIRDAACTLHLISNVEFQADRFPRKGDDIFSSGPNCHQNACLNYGWDSNHSYIAGYAEAARLLALQVCYTQNSRDTMVYPIVFLYRHHAELMLKRLLTKGHGILKLSVPPLIEKALLSHRIDVLWTHLKPIINQAVKQFELEVVEQDLQGVEYYILELTRLDPDSMRFRYAKTKEGNPSLPGVKLLNIGTFCEAIERLVFYLDAIDSQFCYIEEYQAEAGY